MILHASAYEYTTPPDRTQHKVNDLKVDFSGDVGKERSGTSQGLSLAGLCCSSAHLVQCGPIEPSWSLNQIWVLARMPDYSLNWTAKSSAIQEGQRCQCCSSPTRRWPSRCWSPFDLESAIDFDTSSGTNARRSC